MKKFLPKKRIALAVLFTFLFYLFYPPLRSISELGQLTIVPNKQITASEVPEYIFEHINKDFTAYFGETNDKNKAFMTLQTSGKSIDLEFLPKDVVLATPTASIKPSSIPTPEQTPSIAIAPSPNTTESSNTIQTTSSPSPTPTPILEENQSSIAAQLKSQLSEIQQSLASISGKVQEIASQAGQIGQEVRRIVPLEILNQKTDNGDILTFKNADGGVDITITPTGNSLKQKITMNNAYYKWPITMNLNINGLDFNKNSLGEVLLTDSVTHDPIVNLGAFIISDQSGITENASVDYFIEDGKLILQLLPSNEFVLNENIKPPITIENEIMPTSKKEEEARNSDEARQVGQGVIAGKSIRRNFEDSTDNFKFIAINPTFKARLFDKSGKFAFNFERDGKSINLTLKQERTATISKKQLNEKDINTITDQIEAKNIGDGDIDMRYKPMDNGIKEEIILNNQNKAQNFPSQIITTNGATVSASLIPLVFNLQTNGVKPEQDESGKIHFADTTTNKRLYYFEKPYATDANNNTSYGVYYKLDNSDLSIFVEDSWLKSPDRAFPITIDPTVTLYEAAKYNTGTNYSFQRKSWYDGTRYWIAYHDGVNFRFYYSTNGSSWTENTSAAFASANYDETATIDTSLTNTTKSTYSSWAAGSSDTWQCEQFTPGISGKVAQIDTWVGVSTWQGIVSVKTVGTGCDTTPDGTDITVPSFYGYPTDNLNGNELSFYFGSGGTPLYKGNNYCLCMNTFSPKRWYGSTSTNHYKRIYLRQPDADFSVYGDESNFFIAYAFGNGDIRAKKQSGTYPGTNWTTTTRADIFDGGSAGYDGDARFDLPNIAFSNDKVYVTARKQIYAGTGYTDYFSWVTSGGGTLSTGYTDTWYIPYNPTDDVVLKDVTVQVTTSTGNPQLVAALCEDVNASACTPIETVTTNAYSTGTVTSTFTTQPFLSAEKRYRIYFKRSGGTALAIYLDCTATVASCGSMAPVSALGFGVFVLPKSNAYIVGKTTDTSLGTITSLFGDKALNNYGRTATTAAQLVVPSGPSGNVLFLYNRWSNLYNFWCPSSGACSAHMQATGSAGTFPNVAKNMSAVADNTGTVHVVYVNGSGNLVYQNLSSNFITWSAVETLDANTDNQYPTISLGTGNQVVFVTWQRSATTSMYFARRPSNFSQWSTAQTLTSASATSSAWLSSLTTSSEQIAIVRTAAGGGTGSNFEIITDMIDTGLNKQMRHGKTFENETKQPAAY